MSPVMRVRVTGLVLALAAVVPLGAQQGQLVDRVVAVVAGTIITMTDARAAVEFAFVETRQAEDPIAVAVGWLVDRQMVLDEAGRYNVAPPARAAVDEALEALRTRDATPEAFAARLARLGLDESSLRVLVRDNLLASAYLDRRFATVMAVTEGEAEEYYRLRVDRFVRDGRPLSFDEARAAVREAITRERRERAVADWLARLRRRTEIHELYTPRR